MWYSHLGDYNSTRPVGLDHPRRSSIIDIFIVRERQLWRDHFLVFLRRRLYMLCVLWYISYEEIPFITQTFFVHEMYFVPFFYVASMTSYIRLYMIACFVPVLESGTRTDVFDKALLTYLCVRSVRLLRSLI